MNAMLLTDIKSLDALLADPAKVAQLSPEVAQTMLIGLVSLQPLLIQRALMGSQSGQGEPTKKNALTPEQVAVILNVKPSFVYELARNKKLKSYKLGRYVRFNER